MFTREEILWNELEILPIDDICSEFIKCQNKNSLLSKLEELIMDLDENIDPEPEPEFSVDYPEELFSVIKSFNRIDSMKLFDVSEKSNPKEFEQFADICGVPQVSGRKNHFMEREENYTALQDILKKDNIAALKQYASSPSFHADEPINIFDLNSKTLTGYAAYFGAIKCFNYLIVNGGSVSDKTLADSMNSCNQEIIQYHINQGIKPNSESIESFIGSRKPRSSEIFEWLSNTDAEFPHFYDEDDLNEMSPETMAILYCARCENFRSVLLLENYYHQIHNIMQIYWASDLMRKYLVLLGVFPSVVLTFTFNQRRSPSLITFLKDHGMILHYLHPCFSTNLTMFKDGYECLDQEISKDFLYNSFLLLSHWIKNYSYNTGVSLDVVKYILEDLHVEQTNVLKGALLIGDFEIVKYMIEEQHENPGDAIYDVFPKMELLNYLLANNIKFNINGAFYQAIEKGMVPLVELFLENGQPVPKNSQISFYMCRGVGDPIGTLLCLWKHGVSPLEIAEILKRKNSGFEFMEVFQAFHLSGLHIPGPLYQDIFFLTNEQINILKQNGYEIDEEKIPKYSNSLGGTRTLGSFHPPSMSTS